VSGFRFRTVEELVSHTEALIADESLRTRLSDAAEQRATDFAWPAFTASVHRQILAP
jgi:hypothetical protein